jgi:hypothetical protein
MVISFFLFFIQDTLPLNNTSLQVLHIGLLAVAIIFFGLHNLKDYVESKTKACRDNINKLYKNKKDKRDFLLSIINKKVQEADEKLNTMVCSFQYLLYLNIFSLILLSICDFVKMNIVFSLIYVTTLMSFWIIILNSRRFFYLYLYDPDNDSNSISEEMLMIDDKRYDILFEKPQNNPNINKVGFWNVFNPNI